MPSPADYVQTQASEASPPMDFCLTNFSLHFTSFLHIEGGCSIRSMFERSAVSRRTVSGDELTVAVDRGGLVEPSPVALAIGHTSWSALQGLKDNDEAMNLFRTTGSHRLFLVAVILLLLDENSFADLLNDCGECEDLASLSTRCSKPRSRRIPTKKRNRPSDAANNLLHLPTWLE